MAFRSARSVTKIQSDPASSALRGTGSRFFSSTNCDAARYRSRRAASKSCCAQERDFTGNNNVLRISCDRIPVDESETALPSLDVKTDSDAIAIRLLWNLHFAGVRSSNCNSRRLPSIFGGYPRADMARPLAMTPMSKLARIPRGTHRKKYSHGALTFHFRHMRNLG